MVFGICLLDPMKVAWLRGKGSERPRFPLCVAVWLRCGLPTAAASASGLLIAAQERLDRFAASSRLPVDLVQHGGSTLGEVTFGLLAGDVLLDGRADGVGDGQPIQLSHQAQPGVQVAFEPNGERLDAAVTWFGHRYLLGAGAA